MKTVQEILEHHAGKGCECNAWYPEECCCESVDWTSNKTYELQWKIKFLRDQLEQHNLLTEEIKEIIDIPFRAFSNRKYKYNPTLDKYTNNLL